MRKSKKVQLDPEIFNDQEKVNFIEEFLDNNTIWHELCRGAFTKRPIGKPLDKSTRYYPYEKLTFLFLIYNNYGNLVLNETSKISQIFMKSHVFYEQMLKQQKFIKDKKEMIDSFKLNICITSIFNTIFTDKGTMINLLNSYDNFCLKKELDKEISKNNTAKKQIKL